MLKSQSQKQAYAASRRLKPAARGVIGVGSKLNNLRWYVRWPIKWAVFGIAYTVVCFPYPTRLVRHVSRWCNPNALIEPHAPAIEPLVGELLSKLPAGPPSWDTLAFVERFVYLHVPYEWDWNTWGMADYIPTVAEVIAQGREDCDGRAVLDASLLERIGVPSRLVTDFTHVWVATDLGQTMGPRPHEAIEVTEKGMRLNVRGLLEAPRALAYGVSVFPVERQLILLVVFWLLLLDRRMRTLIGATSLVCLVAGLFAVRYGGRDPNAPTTLLTWLGLLAVVFAVVFPMFARPLAAKVPSDGAAPQEASDSTAPV